MSLSPYKATDQWDWLLNDNVIPMHSHDDTDPVLVKTDDGVADANLLLAGRQAMSSIAADLRTAETHDEGPRGTSRRNVLMGMGGLGLSALLAPSAKPRYSFAADAKTLAGGKPDILVIVFLRFGFDGLSLVPPLEDSGYMDMRPSLATRAADCFNLDGQFGLNKNAAALKPLWDEGSLAFVHATGNKEQTKSHFVAQDIWERGAPVAVRSGWAGRHLVSKSAEKGTFRAITRGNTAVSSLTTTFPTLAMSSMGSFDISSGSGIRDHVMRNLESMYTSAGGEASAGAGLTLDAVGTLRNIRANAGNPKNGAAYPNSTFGSGLKEVAQIIRAGVGLEVAACDFSDWDMHDNMGSASNANGWYSRNIRATTEALAAFRKDLGADWNRVTVVTMSEFGRTGTQNANGGLDHGTGNLMMVMGGGIKGKKVYGKWPTLAPSARENGDLAITTDYRTVLSEILTKRLGNNNVGSIFPDFKQTANLGFTK